MGGITTEGLSEDDAWAIAGMLIRTGRAIHPNRWVPELIEEAELAAWEAAGPK